MSLPEGYTLVVWPFFFGGAMLAAISDKKAVRDLVEEGLGLVAELSSAVGDFGKEAALAAAIFSVFQDIKASIPLGPENDQSSN